MKMKAFEKHLTERNVNQAESISNKVQNAKHIGAIKYVIIRITLYKKEEN